MFRLALIGISFGIGCAACITYTNRSRYSVSAKFVPIKLGSLPINFEEIRPIIYGNFSLNYKESSLLKSEKNKDSVYNNSFAQSRTLGIDEIRYMWISAVLPIFRSYSKRENFVATESVEDIERGIVFCEIGSEFGDVCLQVLAETKCEKTVGVEAALSQIQIAEEAAKRAQELFPEVFNGKKSIWIEDDFPNCTDILRKEAVNTIFICSRTLNNNLMDKLTSIIHSVPSVKCIVTSQRIDNDVLKSASFEFVFPIHSSSDWNKRLLFYVYQKQ